MVDDEWELVIHDAHEPHEQVEVEHLVVIQLVLHHVHDNEISGVVVVVQMVVVEDDIQQHDVCEHQTHVDEIDEIEYVMIFHENVLYIPLDDDDECKITELEAESLNEVVTEECIVSDAQQLVIEVDDDDEVQIQAIFAVNDETDVHEYFI